MKDKNHLILTATGPDRVGLVEAISEFVSRSDCNIEDSKMAVFCGEFAIIVLLSGNDVGLTKVRDGYSEIEAATGLTITVKTPATRKSSEFLLPYKLTASCMDHPGVVHDISVILSAFRINIDSMETKSYLAPVSGTPLFQLEAHLAIPEPTNVHQLRERFAELQRTQNIDIEFTAIKV